MRGSFKIGLIIALLLTFCLSIFFLRGTFANIETIETNNPIKIIDLNYTVKDTFICNKKAKEIRFINLKRDYKIKIYLNKTKYFGDAEVKLVEKVNVTKQRIKTTWKCNCTNITINQTIFNNQTKKNETIEKTIEVCQICREYENYTVEVMRKINPENFVLRKDKPIYEVFEGCKKIERLPNGKWGCSVWTDVYILGQKIKGLTWWNSSWSYRQPINISNTAGNLTNYQVRIDLNSTNVGSHFNWSNNGSDIRFTNSTDDLLNYWIEYWNSSSQEAIIWVNVTYLENNTNTTIFLYYGNPSAVSKSSVNKTFIREIDGALPVKGSWHFDEGNGTIAYDYSGNDNDGTIYGANWTDGKFGKALSFDGVDDYVEVPDSESLDITDAITIEAWIKTNTSGVVQVVLNKNFAYQLRVAENLRITGYVYTDSWHYINSYSSIEPNVWYHIVLTYDKSLASGNLKLYINREEAANPVDETGTISSNAYNLLIGARLAIPIDLFSGIIDEVRIYNRALSEEEISDLYNYYGYTTENYAGRVLVRKRVDPEPSVSSFGEEEEVAIQGYVKDPYGNPIEGARVNIIKQSTTGNDTLLATVTTDKNGYYYYATTEKGNFTICAYVNSTTKGECKPFVKI